MTPAPLSARAPGLFFALAVVVLPVTGLEGVDALGELKGAASVYVLLGALLALALVERLGAVAVPRPVLILGAALAAWLVVNAAVNYETIATAVLQDRTGPSKLVTASIVLVFGLAVAVLAGHLLCDPRDFGRLFLAPLTASILICAAFALPELLTWLSPSGLPLYEWTTGLFHTEESEQGRVVGRLASVAFEAPDLSYFTASTLPWLMLGCRRAWRAPPSRDRCLAGLGLACGVALVALSNSRTGFLMLAAFVGCEAAFWLGLRRARVPAPAFTAALGLALAAGVTLLAARLAGVGEVAVDGEDVSTITRSALLTAQLALFADHPIFGVGFGQYGFHAVDLLPSWSWNSYEIERYFELRGELPPAFNVFGRIGAELGIPGLVIWYGFWMAMIHRVAAAAPRLPPRSFALDINAALLGAMVCLVVGGISTDAFRRPETWILVAIAGLYAGLGSRLGRSVR